MEELAPVPTATAVAAAAAAAKRKDLMDNIGSRLNSGAYNAAKNLKKNEKDLREKVKFFEKKEVAGQLKDYMVPRLRLAKDLLVRIQELKGEEPNATLARPVAAARPTTVRPATSARTRARPATVAATAAATVAAPTLAAVSLNSVNRARRGLTIKAPKATRFAKTVKLTRATKSLSPVKSAKPVKSVKTTTSRKRANKEVIMNEHFMQAMNEFLPLPVLHDPFTGRQYAPEENPMPEIERAYDMLKDIRVKMQRRAGQLRSKAKTANKRKATAATRKKTVANAATLEQAAATAAPTGLSLF
jgi:hypothetical protein